MGRITERLDGGLVDGPDPASIEPGELSSVTNTVYKPVSNALFRAAGRLTYATATAATAANEFRGLRSLQFDNGDGYLIAMTSSTAAAYSSALLNTLTPTFTVLTALAASGVSLDVTQFRNRYYLFNGATGSAGQIGSNTVVYLSATATGQTVQVRQHGMVPVAGPPQTAYSTAIFALDTVGYYDYWYTEVAKVTQDGAEYEVESTYNASAGVATVYVSATAGGATPALSLGAPGNSITTHWRVYRSPRKEHYADKTFPDGFSVQTISTGITASAQFVDTLTVTQTSQFLPSSVNSSAPYAQWQNPSRLTAADNSYATGTAAVLLNSPPRINSCSQLVYGFNFGGFSGSVLGIEVEIKAYQSLGTPPHALWVSLGRRGADGFLKPLDSLGGVTSVGKSIMVTANSPGQVLTVGSSADRWVAQGVPGFADTDFDSNFAVLLENRWFGSVSFGVDYVKVRVSYGAAQSDSVKQFPNVVYTFGDITAEVGKNDLPPSSNTGDVYEDALVVNDMSNPSVIRYSAPGEPDYFPGTYFIDFETDNNDRVTLVKVVNNRLIVGLQNSMMRVNYLPSERDSSFDRGKAFDPLTTTYGCVNPMCAATYSPDGKSQRMAWVSPNGIHITDGFQFDTVTNHLNWDAILPSAATAVALVNNPDNKDLTFLYASAVGAPYQTIRLSYAERHLQEGRLKTSGKINMSNHTSGVTAIPQSLWIFPSANGKAMTVIGYGSASGAGGGMVFQETGTTIPASDPNMAYATRRMFLAGESNEFRLNEVYAYIGSYTNSPGIDMAARTIKTNDDTGEVVTQTQTQQYAGRKLGKWQFRQIAEGLRLSAVVTGNPNNDMAWEYLILDGEGFGSEDSGK